MYAVKAGAAGVGDAQMANKVRIIQGHKHVSIILVPLFR
jgi:hypothetical protein